MGKRERAKGGHILGKPGSINQHNHFNAQVYFLTKAEGGRSKPFTKYYQTNMYCKTWASPAMMEETAEKGMNKPGEDCNITFKLKKKMVMEKGMRFTMRDSGTTLGHGVVTEMIKDIDVAEEEANRKAARKKEGKEKAAREEAEG